MFCRALIGEVFYNGSFNGSFQGFLKGSSEGSLNGLLPFLSIFAVSRSLVSLKKETLNQKP